jgi:eukaryotic-like serine/threonine-protein kinase
VRLSETPVSEAVSDTDRTALSATIPLSESGQSDDSHESHTRVEAARVRGSDPSAGFAPSGASAARDFLAERLALFARIACLASSGFLLVGVVLNALVAQSGRRVPFERLPVFHVVATAVLLLVWLVAGSRSLSNRGLRLLDAAGTIAAGVSYAVMASTMPFSWRPDLLVLLILNAVLLGRAALVPSEPRRTAWISAASVLAIPFATVWIFRADASGELPIVPLVINATLWATFTVVLATVISSITFHLRRSVVRARRLGQYTLLDKIGEGGMGAVYRAEHQMLRRPTAIKPPAVRAGGAADGAARKPPHGLRL